MEDGEEHILLDDAEEEHILLDDGEEEQTLLDDEEEEQTLLDDGEEEHLDQVEERRLGRRNTLYQVMKGRNAFY